MKVFIQDKKTRHFWAVQCKANPKGYLVNADDEGDVGESDFPYWTEDIQEAFDFRTEKLAALEMDYNDCTDDGTRKPIILKLSFSVDLAKRIRKERLKKGWSRYRLAKESKLFEQMVARLESGENVTLDKAEHALTALGLRFAIEPIPAHITSTNDDVPTVSN
jgi:hypothetical protein